MLYDQHLRLLKLIGINLKKIYFFLWQFYAEFLWIISVEFELNWTDLWFNLLKKFSLKFKFIVLKKKLLNCFNWTFLNFLTLLLQFIFKLKKINVSAIYFIRHLLCLFDKLWHCCQYFKQNTYLDYFKMSFI